MKLYVAALCAAVWVMPLTWAQAQTPATKPATKPAAGAGAGAGSKTLSLGDSSAAAPGTERRGLMTRDELRSCLKSEASIRTRLEALDGQRAPLETEKAAITTDQQAFKDERATMEAEQKAATDDLNARFKAFAGKVEQSNARVQAFNEAGKAGNAAERERLAINAERAALDEERKTLEADRDRTLERLRLRVASYNDKARLVDQRVADWNLRNNQLADTAQTLETERAGWVGNCSNRRYREDDEIAIKAGK